MNDNALSALSGPATGSSGWWDARYRNGDAPWDTGIVPPEVRELVDSGVLAPGWALDLGCGSGVSSRYLAQHGFRVVGIDLAPSALARAARATAAGALAAYFCLGDAADLGFLSLKATFALDIGCFHSVAPERRRQYVAMLAERLLPGAYFLLYAFEPALAGDAGPNGVGPRTVAHFAPLFILCRVQHGADRGRPSAWYLFRRTGTGARAVRQA